MKFNERYFSELGTSPEVENQVVEHAERIADVVRRTAPVDSGEYRDRVRVDVTRTPFRTVARVIADTDHGMLVEARHGTLARALRAVGDG